MLVYDPYLTAEQIASFGAVKAEMEEVLKESDFISLHMPVTEETRGMINAKTLAMMKPRAILINTARGPLVNSADLLDALKNNKIAAAGLDTHECEPLPKDSPFFELDNVVLTDHTAYFTEEGSAELKAKAAQNVAAVLMGQEPAYSVNKL